MVELKEKTVEELRKMASRKKIEGRSKMNKAQLVRALKKPTTTKKRKMKGGRLTPDIVQSLLTRDYNENPLYILLNRHHQTILQPIRSVTLEPSNRGDVLNVDVTNYINVRINDMGMMFYTMVSRNGYDYLVDNYNERMVLPIPPQA